MILSFSSVATSAVAAAGTGSLVRSVNALSLLIPYYRARHAVKPGITGWYYSAAMTEIDYYASGCSVINAGGHPTQYALMRQTQYWTDPGDGYGQPPRVTIKPNGFGRIVDSPDGATTREIIQDTLTNLAATRIRLGRAQPAQWRSAGA